VETSSLGLWRILTSCVSARQASEELSPGRDPHRFGCMRPLDLAIADNLTVITRSRILDMVLRRTMMRKEAGEWLEALPGLSSTTPFVFFKDEGCYPNVTSGERSSRMIGGLASFTLFHTEYGTPSGPGAEEGELLARASPISSAVRGSAEGFFVRRPLPGRGSLGGKKLFRSALLIATGSEASGREGNLGVFLGATNCLAVQMLFGEVFGRKSAQ